MGKWLARIGIVLLAATPAASVNPPASVLVAAPGNDGGAIARFTVRFSEPMVPLGADAGPPLSMACATRGAGRWIDPATFVWEFAAPLSGGGVCRATLNEGLKTLSRRPISGTSSFAIDPGGPTARAILTGVDSDVIEEGQTFLIATNGPADRASVAAQAYCTVDGIGERIAVDLLPTAATATAIAGMGRNWRVGSFLEEAGLPSPLPVAARDRAAALANIVALKCRRPLPPGRDVALVWSGAIVSPAGRPAGADRRFDLHVREGFSARLTCFRVNPRAGCNPVQPMTVAFTAAVPRATALAVRLEAGGRRLAPAAEGTDATVTEVTFAAPLPPATTGRLLMPANVRDESGRSLDNARRFPLDVAIAEAPPLVKFAAPFGILEAKQGGVLPVTVRAVEPALEGRVAGVGGGSARIAPDDRLIAAWLRRVSKAQDSDYTEEKRAGETVTINRTGARPLLAGGSGVRPMRLALPGKGKAFEVVGIPLARPGFYVVELASPVLGRALLGRPAPRYVAAAALVTDMAVHFKWGRGVSLAWVTALDDAAPVAGAAVKVSDSCTGRPLAAGTTDASGRLVIRAGLPPPSTADGCEANGTDSPPLIVSATKAGDYSFVLTSWANGIRPFDFDLPYGWSAPTPVLHTIFDRTLLRAGETVNMKHVWRAPTLAGFRSGGAFDGTLVLQHRGSQTSFELPLSIGRDGIGETRWTPPRGAPTGDYDLSFRVGAETTSANQSVRVDEYRLPSMRASVTGPKTPAVRPRRLPIDLYVGYLSGGGAGRAPVQLRTAYEAIDAAPAGWEGWTFSGSAVREGTVALDEDRQDSGRPVLPAAATIPLTLGPQGALRTPLVTPALADNARLTVEMDYQDANGETLTAATAIPLYTASVRLGMKPDGWMQRAGDMRLKIAALGLDGRPAAGQRVTVTLYTREILSARRRLIGGFYAFDNSARTTRIDATCSERTDATGLATCALDPGVSGEVIAVATTTDAAGNEARATTSIWLAGADDWWFGGDNGDRMDIVPDAKAYRAGATAHVQVRMPFRRATALVTVEREGVLASFVTTISGKDPTVDVPLPGGYAPDVYISVTAVRGRIAGWRLWLADFARRWHLPFFSREGASPTALVDLAKPGFRFGIAKVAVGWDAHRLAVAVQADRTRYRVRDHARVAIRVTGPDGRPPADAEVAFAAVDEALLQLSPNDSWNILDAMMGERPLSVLTSTAQMQVVGKRHYGRKAVAAGGGGGGGDLSALTRADFRPVLLWRGRVKLDAAGRAVVDVPLADALSSFRLVAVATAGGDLFGTGSTTVRTMQDLALYSGIPPLVRSGDFYGATFTLRNGSDRPLKVTATVAVTPAVAHGAPLTVTIPPGGAAPVTWRLTAPEGVASLRWTVSARSADGRAADRVQVDEQVIPAVPEETLAATFVAIGAATRVPVAMPPGALPDRGGIEVALAASPAPPLAGVRAYMAAYPYGCFEQRLSKAVALDDRAGWGALAGELPTYLAPDGLLRYFPGDQRGSIALTAYALSMTAEAGFAWPDAAKARAMDAMRGVVDGRIVEEGGGPTDRRLLRLAALAALARNAAVTPGMLGQAAVNLSDLPTALLADWLVTLDRTPGVDPRLTQAAQAALRARIVYEGTRLDLTDRAAAPWWMMSSGDEMALKALLAVIGRPGWAGEVPRMMIGVALRQRRGHWDTTPANAWGTIAARRFDATYPGVASGVTTVRLGARSETRGWPQAGAGPIRLPLPMRAAPLLLAHSVSPGPWATVSVRAAVPLTLPVSAGYRLSRAVSFLQQRVAGRLSRGDVLKVRITLDAPVDRTWVVVEDPIPAGATIVGGQGGQSAILAAQADGGEGGGPSYVERGLGAWRGYYGWLPRGRTVAEYAVRINGAGRFQLPPTRAEAMYSPEIRAALPNRPIVVAP